MSTDPDDRHSLALDFLLTSFRGRPLPWMEDAEKIMGEALALADAFLRASAPIGNAEEVADMPQALRSLDLCRRAAASHGLDGMATALGNVLAFLEEKSAGDGPPPAPSPADDSDDLVF